MDWKIQLDDDEPQQTQPTGQRQELEEGTHELQIKQMVQESYGLRVGLAHDDRRYSWVWCRMYKDGDFGTALAKQLLRALGITSAEWSGMDPGDLVGRRLRVEVYHNVDKNSHMWVNVRAFLPTEQYAGQPAAKPEPRPCAPRTPAAKAAAEWDDKDDIPF